MTVPRLTTLTRDLRTIGWTVHSYHESALITGLTTTTLDAPGGHLTARVEQFGSVSALTLDAYDTARDTPGARFHAWQATATGLTATALDAIGAAATRAVAERESGPDEDRLFGLLTAAGWTYAEERAHDQLLAGVATSPDGTRTVSVDDSGDEVHIAHRNTGTTITASDTTPPGVVRAMATAD